MNVQEMEDSLLERGYYVIKNFIPLDICNNIINSINSDKKYFTQSNINLDIEGSGKDLRCTNYENFNNEVKLFLHNNDIHNLFEKLLNRKIVKKRCQAGIVCYNNIDNISSGGGWHIDNKNKQYKALLYLNGVDSKNGPFVFIKNTAGGLGINNTPGDKSQTRYLNETIMNSNLIDKTNIIEILGEAGTCILVDTSNIHRGKIIEEGVRYSLTNYYY